MPARGGAAGSAMTSDIDIYRSARLWLDRHGKAAVAEARSMVEAMRQKEDASGADAWLRIIVTLEELRRREPRPGESLS
jgi:hypothetical protein